jgi:Tc5 transposase DNA-binding domain
MRSKSALQYKQEEVEIQRALRTIEGDPHSNISKLSRDSGLSYDRLLSRHHGRPSRSDRSPAGKKLTEGQEEELLHQVRQLGRRIIFRRRTICRSPIIELANRILERDCTEEGPLPTVGTQWCGRFIKRHQEHFKSETNDQLLRE